MSTYPVDIKTVNITTADTHTVFNGPARILGLSWVQPYNVAAGTITVLDDSTTVCIVTTPATDTTDYKSPFTWKILLPGTVLRCVTRLVLTNVLVTHVTVFYFYSL